MKRNYILLLTTVLSLGLASCDKDLESEDLTYVENYPVITTVDGKKIQTQYLKLGDSFTPTCSATLSGADITSAVEIKILNKLTNKYVDQVTTTAPCLYEISYSAETENKLTTWSEIQTVFVYNPDITLNIEGVYKVDETQTLAQDVNGKFDENDKTKYYPLTNFFSLFETAGPIEVTIKQIKPGFYTISDALFGWYTTVVGYGDGLEAPGYLSLDEDNNVTLLSSTTYWKDGVTTFSSKYDVDSKSLSFELNYVGAVDLKGLAQCKEDDKDKNKKN